MGVTTYTFEKNDRSFRHICTGLAALFSVSAMTTAQKFGYAQKVYPGASALLYGKLTTDLILSHNLYDLVQPVAENKWPDSLVFFEKNKVKAQDDLSSPDPLTLTETGEMGITWSLMGQAYLAFFEDIRHDLIQKLGRDSNLWSYETLKFGYQIRNAVAHSGRIHFNRPDNSPVSWKGLYYSHANNGKVIFEDIGVVELILLMFEIESVLKTMS